MISSRGIRCSAPMPYRLAGVTLLELMIVVTIVAILGAIAYPAYDNHVRKSYRADAQSDLLELASFMERFFTENNRYDQDTGGTAVSLPFSQTPRSGTARYQIAFTTGSLTATAYTLQATAQSVGSQNADPCGNMTIDQTGAKTPATGTDGRSCW